MEVICSEAYKTKLFNGSETPVAGWRSLYYGHKETSPQLKIEMDIKSQTRLITILKKNNQGYKSELVNETLSMGERELRLLPIGSETIFDYMELEG